MSEKRNKVHDVDNSSNQLLENKQLIEQTDGALGEKGTEIPGVSSDALGKGESEGNASDHGDGEIKQAQEHESVTVDEYNPNDGRALTVDKNSGELVKEWVEALPKPKEILVE